MIIYAAGGKTPPPWLSQPSLAVDWAVLDPSADEVCKLKAENFVVEEIDPANLSKKDLHVKQATLLPFYWGFDVGMSMPADDVYKMLTIIEKNADDLGKLDPSFKQITGRQMAAFQKKARESTWDIVPIHPGLANFLREKGLWDKKWDTRHEGGLIA